MPSQRKPFRADPDKITKMSGKFDIDDFNPKVFSTHLENPLLAIQNLPPLLSQDRVSHPDHQDWVEVLSCFKRVVLTRELGENHSMPDLLPPKSVSPDTALTSQKTLHLVAIALTHPVIVFYGLPGNFGEEQRNWVVNDVSMKGISKRCAQAALGAAWKGYGEGGIKWPAINVASFKFSAPYRTLGVNTERPQDVTMLRDVTLWLCWDEWERKKLSLEQRTEILYTWGYECTPKALKRVVEKVLG